MAHFLFAYTLCGIYTALVIATVDLLTPKKPQMGVVWTLVTGTLWPFFLVVVGAVAMKRFREKHEKHEP